MSSNYDKLDLMADLIEPAGRIISDKAWAVKWTQGDKYGAIREAIKGHKDDIVEILARVEGVEPEAYEIDGVRLFFKLAAMLNRPDLETATGLFTQQDQKGEGASSGPATRNIEDGAQ